MRVSNIYDGQANTVMYSENLLALTWDDVTGINSAAPYKINNSFVWQFALESGSNDNPLPGKNSGTANPPTTNMRINGNRTTATSVTSTELLRPSSHHPGGVNSCFADGHTTFLSDKIQYHVYQQIMTTNHKKSLNVPYYYYILQDADLE
jgi:prepilin-type processing-associated H-X9-DG protein